MNGYPHVRQMESYRIEASELALLRRELRAAPSAPRRRRLALRRRRPAAATSCTV